MTTPIEEILENIQRSMRSGEYLKAYDWALIGLNQFPDNSRLHYLAVLALARTGATDQARARYQQYGLDQSISLDSAALGARLVKDKALISHPRKKSARFIEAAELYQRVFDAKDRSEFYPAINAATTYYLAGELSLSRSLAEEVLKLCQSTSPNYWRYASEAEAHILLGNQSEAKQALEEANKHAGKDLAAIAGTKKQLALICDDNKLLSTLKLPGVAHYAGHIISPPNANSKRFQADQEQEVAKKVSELVERLDIGIAYGSLAAGADILFAEAILQRGGEIHVTLPFDLEEFKEISVAPSGQGWLERFDHCWAAAKSQSFTSSGQYAGDNTLFDYCSLYSMGRACLRHQHLAAPLHQLLIWDGFETNALAGTYRDYKNWTELGFDSHIVKLKKSYEISNRTPTSDVHQASNIKRMHAIVFGDIKGFSSLTDTKLPIFVDQIMGCIAGVLESIGEAVLMANTWGDGLFIVLENVEVAAKCAIDMQKALKKLEISDPDLNEKAELRLGIHFGPIYTLRDPITKRGNFFGEHVNRAARIEPITPPRQVYVTEAFAAQLALKQCQHYKTEYVGYMPMAKNYGELAMYLLREKFDD